MNIHIIQRIAILTSHLVDILFIYHIFIKFWIIYSVDANTRNDIKIAETLKLKRKIEKLQWNFVNISLPSLFFTI